MMLQTNYQGSRPCCLIQENFPHFPTICLCKTFDWGHQVGSSVCINMVHTKYQGSRLNCFRQEDFKVFISKIDF